MPAPRTCRGCGADLPPSVRWCSLCFASVVEFSPRPYVPAPIAEGYRLDRDPAGHWSRWEKSATTMGPRGRFLTSVVIAIWLLTGFFFEFLITWVCQLFLLSWVLKGVWAKGWAIPSAADTPRIPLSREERQSLVPRYVDWREASMRTKLLLIMGAILTAAFYSVWSTGDHTRQGIMALVLTIAIGVPVLYQMVKPP